MKTKEYVKKYELNKSDKFDHSEFVADLTVDFMTLLEVGKGDQSLKGYENAVRAVRMKFDAVNNKTVGCIPEKLWGYFFATVIVKMREEFFPTEMNRRREQQAERKRIWEERKNNEWEEYDFWSGFAFRSMLAGMLKKKKPTSSFETLGLEADAGEAEVKSAFRKLSLIHHPDKGGKDAKFVEITEAKNKCMMYLAK